MSRFQVEELEPSDLEEAVAFHAARAPEADASLESERGGALERLRWYLFANPARQADVPAGWIVRDRSSGRVLGTKYCSPQRFRSDAREFLLLLGGGYYVDPSVGGAGLVLMSRFLAAGGDRHALFATTMNQVSGAIYERYGGYPIPGSDHELLGILRFAPVVEEWLVRRGLRPGLARALSALAALRPSALRAGEGGLRRIESADAIDKELASLGQLPEVTHHLSSVRDPDFLRWRYFEGPDPLRALYVYEGSGGRALAGVNLRTRGYRRQVRTLTVLDLWGSLPVEETPALVAALAARHAGEADALVMRGLLPERERVLRAHGMAARAFPRPIGVCIDRHGLLPTRDWYLVPADGDMGH